MRAREYDFGLSFCRVCGDADPHPDWRPRVEQFPVDSFCLRYCRSPGGTAWTTVCSGCEVSLGITARLGLPPGPGGIQPDVATLLRHYWERKRDLVPPPPPSSPPRSASVESDSTSPSSAALRIAHAEAAPDSEASQSSRTSATRPPSNQQTSSGSGSSSQLPSGDHPRTYESWGSLRSSGASWGSSPP